MAMARGAFYPPRRLLLGPGPSQISPRVLRASAMPLLGYMDPDFIALMDDTQRLLRDVFGTENEWTMCAPGTGMAGMEAALINVLEPGDEVLVCVQGIFGERLADVARRCGAVVRRVEADWGKALDPQQVADALGASHHKAVALVHAETSTGVLQPLDEVGTLAHQAGALYIVDCVTSLGGVDVSVDRRGIDVAYSGTQKCIGSPPSLAPLTFGSDAVRVLTERKEPVQSFYLDAAQIWRYWGPERGYHQTGMITMIYALHEALSEIVEEGLQARYARHRTNQQALVAGLQGLGLEPLVQDPSVRLPSLTTVLVPDGASDAAVRGRLLSEYGIEIGGGLGQFAGRAWRIGLMGYASQRENVMLLLTALGEILGLGSVGDALGAAAGVYGAAS